MSPIRENCFWVLVVVILLGTFSAVSVSGVYAQEGERPENSVKTGELYENNAGKEKDEPSYEIHGFIDSIFHYEDLIDQPEDWRASTTRGTLRFLAFPAEPLDVKVGIVGRLIGGNEELGSDFYMPIPMQDSLLPEVPDYLIRGRENDFYIQEAYVTLKLNKFWLRGGRQKFITGSGYAYNPTDLFNQPTPLDPTYEADGFDGVATGYDFDQYNGLDFFIRPSESRPPDFSARAGFGGDSWQFKALFSSVERFQTDWMSVNNPQGVAFIEAGGTTDFYTHAFRWNQPAIGFRKSLPGVEVYGEAGYVFVDPPASTGFLAEEVGNHERILLGIRPYLGERITFLAEYLRLGECVGGDRPITLNGMMGYFDGKILSTSRDNVYSEITLPIHRRIDFQFMANIGINHYYGFYSPWLHFKLTPKLRFSVSTYHCPGADDGPHSDIGFGSKARLRWDF